MDDWKKIKILYPKRKHLKLNKLDMIPYYDENNKVINYKKHERLEQWTTNERIEPNDVVLELGGRYGLTACAINNKLENPKNHVVFEPDKTVIKCLIKNRKSHKSKFTIFNGIISEKPKKLYLNGFATTALNTTKNDKNKIPSWTLKEIMDIAKLDFNVLVADCEGCLCDFFEENKNYLKNYKTIIFEKDYPDRCDYNNIHEQLLKYNFKCVQDEFVVAYLKL